MAEVKFSYGEAISHGWEMTKEHWKIILLLGVIYVLCNVPSGVLEHFAGSGNISRQKVSEVYEDSAQADRFHHYLQEAGYIDTSGKVLDKLQRVTAPVDLTLPADFEDKGEDIYDFLNGYRYRLPFPKAVFWMLNLILWVLNVFVSIGFIKACLMLSRNQKPAVTELFSNGRFFISYFLGGICYALAVLGGLILLIIPGIIFMIMFQMYAYLIIDKGLGPMASLKRSRVITKGSKGRLALLGLLLLALNIVGLLCLVVGLFFTISISSIAMAYVYDRLENAPVVG